MPYNWKTAPCTRIKFDNGDDWCQADACGAAPPPAPPAPPAPDKGPQYVYFRHVEALRGEVASRGVHTSKRPHASTRGGAALLARHSAPRLALLKQLGRVSLPPNQHSQTQ